MGYHSASPAGRPGQFFFSPLAIAMGVLTAALPMPASARGAEESHSVVVRHVNRNPRTPAEARKLYRKLGEAALKACGAAPGSLVELRRAVRRSDCWEGAMARAIASVGSPLLATVAERARGRTKG